MEKEKNLNSRLLIFFGVAASVLINFSRRPDALLNPQFWAEDGRVWYEQAYNNGLLSSLLNSEAGYFQTIPRLIAGFSQLFVFDYAPLIFNLSAISVRTLVVCFMLSGRLDKLLPNLWWKIFAAFIYLAVPHSYESHGNVTNIQWHLAFLCCLVIISIPAKDSLWKIFDVSVVAVSAVSGPFCLFIFPLAVIKYWHERDRETLLLAAILFVGVLVQGGSLLLKERLDDVPNGASIKWLSRILAGHLFASAIVGEKGNFWMHNQALWKDVSVALVNIVGITLIIYALIKSNLELRLLLTFSFLIIAGALISPSVSADTPQWIVMNGPGNGARYWILPIFCFLLTLFWLANRAEHKIIRFLSIGLLILSSIGIVSDWRLPPYQDLDFPKYAAKFSEAKPGEEVIIPINPNWEMRLIKK